MADRRLERISERMELLGVHSDSIALFADHWYEAEPDEQARLEALGDVRLVEELRHQAGGASPRRPLTSRVGRADPLDTLAALGDPDGDVEYGRRRHAELGGDPLVVAPPVHVEGDPTTEALNAEAETLIEGGATMKQVIEWVGDDPFRAAAAYAAETEFEGSRPSLVKQLAKLALPAA